MADGDGQQYDTTQLDTVQHPTLGPLKFPKEMPFEERNQHIQKMLQSQPPPQQKMSDQELKDWTRRTAPQFGAPTVGGTVKEISGDINEGLTQGLGRNAGEMWGNVKGWANKYFNPTNPNQIDPITGATDWIGNMIEGQYGPHGAVAHYSPDTDLGKRSIAAIPILGPTAASAIESAEGGRWSEAARTTGKGMLNVASAAALPEAGREATRIGGEAINRIGPALERRSLAKSTKEIKEAAPPGRHEIDYNAQLERAKPYLAEEQRTAPVKDVRQAHEAANSAIKNIESKTGEYARSLPDERVSGQEVLDRVEQKLRDPNSPRTEAEIQAGLKAVQDFMTEEVAGEPTEEGEAGEPERVAKDFNLEQIDRLRWRMNRDTGAEMGGTEADLADVRASNPRFAAKEEAGNALRDIFYGRLERGGIPGVRELRGDEGAVIQMRDAFRRNITRAEKSNAPSAMRRIGVFGPIGLGFLGETLSSHLGAPPGVSAGLGIGTAAAYEFMRNRMRPNPLMERGFRRIGKSSLEPRYPEVRPQPPAEAIGTPIEPTTTPRQPPNAGRGGVNEPITPQPGIGEPVQASGEPESDIEMDIRRGGRYEGPERRVNENPVIEERRERPAPLAPQPPISEEGLARESERGQAALAAEREAEEEPVETEVKGVTAKEPKVKAKRESLPSPEKLYSPEEITDAEGLLAQESGAMASADRPGVYYDQESDQFNPEGHMPSRSTSASKGITAGGSWRGVKSGREMFPFMREHPDWNPMAIQKALRNKDSALYKRAISAAVEFIRQEEAAEREAIQAESQASISGEPIFPGMGREVAQQQRGAAQVKAEELSRQMNEPKSIESAAGEMETKSPLFRGTAASPQNEMFGQPIEERAKIPPTSRVIGRGLPYAVEKIERISSSGDRINPENGTWRIHLTDLRGNPAGWNDFYAPKDATEAEAIAEAAKIMGQNIDVLGKQKYEERYFNK